MKPHHTFTILAACAALLLPGCAQTVVSRSESNVAAGAKTAEALRQDMIQSAASATVQRTVRPRLAGEEISVRPVEVLPPVLAKRITYSTSGAQTLQEVLQTLAQQLAIPIRAGEISQSPSNQQAAGTAPGPAAGGGAAGPVGPLTGRVQIDFINRPASALLDEIAAQNDASWRYSSKSKAIEFFRYETRTLSVYLPPGAKSISASISLGGGSGGGSGGGGGGGSSGGGSGGSGSGGGDVSVSQSLTVDPWSSIMSGISTILGEGDAQRAQGQGASGAASGGGASGGGRSGGGGGGASGGASAGLSAMGRAGRATANPELGIISVTARPAAVERIAAYVASVNSRFAQNVMVDVKIYSVTMNTSGAYGFSLDALYKKLNTYGVNIVGPSPLQAGNAPGQLTVSWDKGRWAGSNVVVQALSQFGDVSLQTQGQVIAINGQPSPIQVANEVNYLAASSTTTSANVGATTSLTPGTRVVGFTANFLPLILGDNRILLQYQMQISQLTALTQVGSGNNVIQTPQISSQSLQQQAFVQDGQSIVLFGFDQNRDTADTAAGIGGASKAGTTQRQMMVIVMQVNGGRKTNA